MKGYNISRTFKVLLVALVAFTSVFVFNTITSAEDFDISAEITYAEDKKTAVISLDATNIGEDYVLEEVKNPDGNSMDLMNLNYTVNENGLYEFTVVYYDSENTKLEYTKVVEVNGIQEDELLEEVEEQVQAAEEKTLEEDNQKNEQVFDRSSLLRSSSDYTSQVIVVDWDIFDLSGNVLNTTNGTDRLGSYYQLVVQWSLTPSGGIVLHENDTFTLPLPVNQMTTTQQWTAMNSEWENFTDASSTVLGQWRIYSGKIEVKLGANVEGKQSISGTLSTGENALRNNVTNGCIQDVVLGVVTKSILYNQLSSTALTTNDIKYSNSVSNSRIQWRIDLSNKGLRELTSLPWGTTYTVQNNTYIEDELDGSYGGSIAIQAYISHPTDLSSGTASGFGNSAGTVNSKFTRVYQTGGETYASFKARLNVFEYGIYEDTSGVQTIVINFGDIGNNGMKYSDVNASFAETLAQYAIDRGLFPESDRSDLEDYYETVYGDTNVINGNVAKYVITFYEDHPKVITDTVKTNTAIITKNGTSTTISGSETLKGNSGSASAVDGDKARVWLTDVDDGEFLNGVSMKLQRYDGTNWVDYGTWSGAISTDGYVDTSSLGAGTYRFIQQGAYSSEYDLPSSDGYDTSFAKVVSTSFTIVSGDTEGKTVYMTNVKYKYDVIYAPGTQGTFTTITHNDIVINSTTPAYSGTTGSDGKPAGNVGYTFNGWSPIVSSTVTADATYVAQWSANTDTVYKIEHYLEQPSGSYTLKDTENKTGTTATTVTATPKTYAGYTYDGTVSGTKTSGVVAGDGSLVLKLYYTANTNTVYKIEHHLEQPDGSYTLKETENKAGTTGTIATAASKTYVGYTYDSTVSGTKVSGVIAGDGSLILKLYYTANTNTVYKIEHHLEQPDGTYTLKETENKSGMTGATATAVSKTYAGYTYDSTVSGSKVSGVIAGDGSLILKLYYTANTDTAYKVEHYLEQPDGSYTLKDTDNLTGITGDSVSATPKSYAGYTVNLFHTSSVLSGSIAGDGSLTLKLYYEANTNTEYKVEHYLEQPDGSFALEDTDSLTGTTGHTATAVANTYVGYTYDNSVSGSKISGIIAGDGSLVLKLYYTANTDTAYTVEHYLEQSDGTYVLEDTDNLTGTTGHTVTAIAKMYAGYTFDNTIVGTVESGIIAGDGSLVLELYYTANTDTAYIVEHYLEQPDGSYVLEDTDNLTGTTGASVTAIANTYAGYTLDLFHVDTLLSGNILGDGSLVLKLYYTANMDTTYKIEHYQEQLNGTYELVDADSLSGTTGASVTASPKTYPGFTFDNTIAGTMEKGTILGDGSLVLKLYYTLNTDTVYNVEHHLEQDDKSYKLHETEILAGTTGSTVNAIEKTYTGYEFDKTVKETIISGTVDGDGTLVLKLYYNKEPELTITTTPVHSNPSIAGGVNAVNTSDETNASGYAGAMLISLFAVLYVLRKRRVINS